MRSERLLLPLPRAGVDGDYFALPPLLSDDAGVADVYGPGVLVWPCLTVLAMGWSHSVYVAQSAHERLLDDDTLLRPCDRITHTSDLLVDRVRHMVYIDDIIMLGTDPVLMGAMQRQYVEAAAERHLPAKPSKVVAPTADGMDALGLSCAAAIARLLRALTSCIACVLTPWR